MYWSRGIWLLMMGLFIVGCNSPRGMDLINNAGVTSSPGGQTGSANTKQIALVVKTMTNPFFAAVEKGARRAGKEQNVSLVTKTGAQETSIDQQIAIVEELIRDKVDALVIAPASSTELIPVLKKAQVANIQIVVIDSQLDPEMCRKIGLTEIPFISVDNEAGAYLSAQYISAKITAPTEVAILEGIVSAKNSQDRRSGALRAFRENALIRVVAVETANWKIDEAHDRVAELYRKFPDLGAFFCANDFMALGTVKYLQETGKKHVLVAAYDAIVEARQAIKNGHLAVTIDQQADIQGYLGVQYAAQLLRGEKPPLLTLLDVKVVSVGDSQ